MVVDVTELVENKGTYILVRTCVVCVCVISICVSRLHIFVYQISCAKYRSRHKDVCVNGIGSFAYGQLSM